jgi:acetyl-CoA C-acetyltransferase
MGVPPDKRVFLHGAAAAHDEWFMSDRPRLAESMAVRLASRSALALAGRTLADVDLLDFYSCFPSAVQIARKELGLSTDDPRPLTVTGGLAFFGGPGNNYSTHAIAEMVSRLRQAPSAFGMVLANGGLMTKESIGIYSARPTSGEWLLAEPEPIQRVIDAQPKVPFTDAPSGDAIVESYTVMHLKGRPDRGIVLGRLASSGERFIGNFEPSVLEAIVARDAVGLRGAVRRQDGINVLRLHTDAGICP